jgi:hypothetical protein
MTPMHEALRLAEEYSLPVFPCNLDKRPHTEHGLKDASKNIEQIAQWWNTWPDALVGVPTGAASDLVVLDIDPGGESWHSANATRLGCGRVHKTRRGHHLLYRMPSSVIRNSAGKLAKGVDVRGEGGYVIWWPAHGFKAVGELEGLTEWPQWLTDTLTTKANGKLEQTNGHAEDHVIVQGGRNDYLSREAFRLRKQGSSVKQINDVLAALNQATCVPVLTDAEVQAIASGKERVLPAGVTLDDFYAHMPSHQYIFVPIRDLWPASSVNARIPAIPGADGKPIRPSAWLDEHHAVEQTAWAPGMPAVIEDRLVSNGGWIDRAGCRCFNLYLPSMAALGNPENASLWLEHVHRVYPDDAGHIVKWLAHRVQRPAEKINHALVLGGLQGIGKDTLLEPVKYAVGPWNFNEVSPGNMLGRFNSFVKSVILRISEAHDLGEFDRFAFYDHMKVYTAAPPDVLRCDEKHLREHAVMNVCGVILTTNHKADGIYLPADDRRHYVAWSTLTKDDFADDYWRNLWAWYSAGGLADVAAYLAELDLTGFDPKAPPPKTAAFWDIVDANRAPEDAELADVLDVVGNPDALTLAALVVKADDQFREWLQDRRNRRQIPHRLESVGYVPVRNDAAEDGLWKVGLKRQAIYARKGMSVRDRRAAATDLCRKPKQ